MLYLDCKSVGENQFELTWGLPIEVKQGDCHDAEIEVVDKSVTHMVVGHKSGGQEWVDVKVEKSPFRFEGTSLF